MKPTFLQGGSRTSRGKDDSVGKLFESNKCALIDQTVKTIPDLDYDGTYLSVRSWVQQQTMMIHILMRQLNQRDW